MLVDIEVTQEDIIAGTRCNSLECPIFLALQRATAGKTIAIGIAQAYKIEGKYSEIDLPAAACEFIQDFDNEEPVQPFSFSIDIPTAWLGEQEAIHDIGGEA